MAAIPRYRPQAGPVILFAGFRPFFLAAALTVGAIGTMTLAVMTRASLGRAGSVSVWVNCYQVMDPAVPFGGYKMSGYGRESGLQQMEEYLNVKAVWIKTA